MVLLVAIILILLGFAAATALGGYSLWRVVISSIRTEELKVARRRAETD